MTMPNPVLSSDFCSCPYDVRFIQSLVRFHLFTLEKINDLIIFVKKYLNLS